jgi:hypothetical protein
MNKPKTKRIIHLVLLGLTLAAIVWVVWESGGSVVDKCVAVGGMFTAAGLALRTALFKAIDEAIDELPDDASPKPPIGPFAAAIVLLVGSFLLSTPARADGLVLQISDNWECSPVGALSGYQYNATTGIFQKGVSLGAGVGCRYKGTRIPLGIDLLGGAAVNDNAPNAMQFNALFVIDDNYGAGPGMQIFRDPVDGTREWQFLASLFLTASWAATIEQFKSTAATAAACEVKPAATP